MSTAAEEMDLIVKSLRERGHTVAIANIRDDLGALVGAIQRHKPDAVFNLIEFFGEDPSNEMHVAGVFDLLGVAYTGSRPETLSLCQKKHRAKAVLIAAGLPTPRYIVINPGERVPSRHRLRFPLIVKPAMEDASGGIDETSLVRDRAALHAKVDWVLKEFEMPALIEEFIEGREIHCAILGNDPPVALPLFEMVFHDPPDGAPLPKIITYKAKWDPNSRDYYSMDGVCPAPDLEPEVVKYIEETAIHAYRTVGCRDYGRVDMRLDPATGEPYILEVNPNPDLSDACAFTQCATTGGMTYADLVDQIAGQALARARTARVRPTGPSDQLLREYISRPIRGARTGAPPRKKRQTG